MTTPRLIFDIETVGVDFDSLDEKAKEFLLFYAETPEEIENVKNGLGFSPLTGEIVAIGILNPDTDKGAVYFQCGEVSGGGALARPRISVAGKKNNLDKTEDKNAQYIPLSSEKEVLEHFWESATHYNQFITFNGHSFDCPFVTIRSAILEIKPTKGLIHNRYYDSPHFDLYDRLTNFGAVRFKRNLHMWCQAFGISSPKAKGISGDDVARLFKDKEYLKIAKYCFDDIKATKELYRYWEKYINSK